MEAGPPALGAGYAAVPVLTIPREYLNSGTRATGHVLSTAAPYPLSLHQYEHRDPVMSTFAVLVRREADGRLVHNSRVPPPKRDYDTSWAVPARIAAAPFIAIGYVLISPILLICQLAHCHI
jgi:hypothetical protein